MIIQRLNNRIEIATPAKINLFLELLGRRDDGFHEIETVMSAVSIFDRLSFTTRTDSDIRLSINYSTRGQLPAETDLIPADDRNLIVKAIKLVRQTALTENALTENALTENALPDSDQHEACSVGMDVVLSKNIPSAAGLGGASSDAAAALVAANEMWNLNWSKQKLEQLAAQLGSDIPFFITGGTAICRGRGEKIEPLNVPSGLSLVVVKPQVSLSTADVFKQVSSSTEIKSADEMLQGLHQGSSQLIGNKLFNRLEQFADVLTSQVSEVRKLFSSLNSLGHQMSGSGSSYFGLFSNPRTARQASRRLSSRLPCLRIFCTQTLSPTRLRPASLRS